MSDQDFYATYLPAGTHYAVTYDDGVCVVELGQPEHQILVNGENIGRQSADGSCKPAECIRIALAWLTDTLEESWAEGTDWWTDVTYELRDGVARKPVPEPHEVGEAAEDWWDALGYTVEEDEVEATHPVCAWDEVESYEPKNAAERIALDYAKRAKRHAQELRATLDEARVAALSADAEGLEDALTRAHRQEMDYGDAPSTRHAAKKLLGDGWRFDWRFDRHVKSLVWESLVWDRELAFNGKSSDEDVR